jgi:hypothetical protein
MAGSIIMARQNDHKRAEELISAYVDKRVSAEEKDFFERHVASCADCRAQLEATRSMITALKAMPAVKAPRSFVLPREMAKEPKRSFLSLYPALRLATVIAAMAFVVLFAGDLLINQSAGTSAPQSIPAAAPAPAVVQAPAAQRAAAPTQAPAAEADNTAATTAPAGSAAPIAGAGSAKMSATAPVTEATTLSEPTATPEATGSAEAPLQAQALLPPTPESTAPSLSQQAAPAPEQSSATHVATAAPTIAPLHIIEIVLLGLAVVLGIATVVVRRKQA